VSTSREVVERLRTRRLRSKVMTAEGEVWVRGLSGKERADYYSWIRGTTDTASIMLSDQRIISLALCDEQGTPMFETVELGIESVGDWNTEDVMLLAKEVLRLSGMARGATDDDEKK
jgi:hypothetical protein